MLHNVDNVKWSTVLVAPPSSDCPRIGAKKSNFIININNLSNYYDAASFIILYLKAKL